ncbi:MAG: GLUG motif-containing protein [Planctomycetota bacterium]
MRKAGLVFLILTVASPCFAKYSGGTGEPNDPYQIADVTDLLILAADVNDYNKCFIMTADIDIDPNLPGRQVFNTSVIASGTGYWDDFNGVAFDGVFDGAGHKIVNLTIDTNGLANNYLGLFGYIDSNSEIKDLGIENVLITNGYNSNITGGFAGHNSGTVSNCFLTGEVAGYAIIGGFIGSNSGQISNCYSSADVAGTYLYTGGFCGINQGDITRCCSTGHVSGLYQTGGLVGFADGSPTVSFSFWDVNTSGQTISAGGIGKTTIEMQTEGTFTIAGWDFVNIWHICESTNYPKLLWQILPGDIVCPDGVDTFDLAELCEQWLFEEIPADLAPPPSGDGIVDFADFSIFASQWGITNDIVQLLDFTEQWLRIGLPICSADISPLPDGDSRVNFDDFAVMANDWLEGF